jgi:hypothetical protein
MHRLVLAAFAVLLAGGCALLEPSATQPGPALVGPLMTIATRGGECPAGACESLIVVERDGRVHRLKPDVAELDHLPADVIDALDEAIRVTNFAAIRSRAFTGECPVNYDGQELIYEFGTPSGAERIASCEVEIDPGHPLFVAVDAALGG